MPIIHAPDFSPGNSLIGGSGLGGDNQYERTPHGPDPADDNYPEVFGSESIQVAAVGPNSEAGIDVYPTSANYDSMALMFGNVGPWTPHAQYNYLKANFKFTAAGDTDTNFAVLMYLVDTTAPGSSWYPIQLYLDQQGTGDNWDVIVDAYSWAGSISEFTTISFAAYVNAWHEWELRWHPGTVTGDFDDVAADGWIQVLVDGVVLLDIQNVDLYLTFAEALPNQLAGYTIGGYGLLGPVYGIELGTPGITGSFVAGDEGTVTATHAVLFNIDGTPRTNSTAGLFMIGGDLEVTGDVTITGDTTFTNPETLMNSIVTTGSEIVLDSSGNIVYVNGS